MEGGIKIQCLCTKHLGYITVSEQNKQKYMPFIYFNFLLVNWIYWGDICQQKHTGFRCTIIQHITCTLYCVFTTPSQASSHHQFSLLYLPPSPPYNHHTAVHIHKFSFYFYLNLSTPRNLSHRCQPGLYLCPLKLTHASWRLFLWELCPLNWELSFSIFCQIKTQTFT